MTRPHWTKIDGMKWLYWDPGTRKSDPRFVVEYKGRDLSGKRRKKTWDYPVTIWGDRATARKQAEAKVQEIETERRRNSMEWRRSTFGIPDGMSFWDVFTSEAGKDDRPAPPPDDDAGKTKPDPHPDSLRGWVEAGVREAGDDEQPDCAGWLLKDDPPEKGWLREMVRKERDKPIRIWHTVRDRWGRLNDARAGQIDVEAVERIIPWMEQDGRINAYSTAKSYAETLARIVNAFAESYGLASPIPDGLRVPPSAFESSSRTKAVRGRQIRKLAEGLETIVNRTEQIRRKQYKALSRYLFEIHRYSGARTRELLALTIDDLDSAPPGVRIDKTVRRGGEVRDPKEIQDASDPPGDYEKWIPLPTHVLDSVRAWIDRREDLDFPPIAADRLVFPRPGGGHCRDRPIRERYAEACEAAGIDKITPRQIRHSVIQRWKSIGMPEAYRMTLVGHISGGVHSNYDMGAEASAAREWIEEMWKKEHDRDDETVPLADELE